jgi:hypothetical protein
MAPPNAFNNELEKLVFNKYIGSVVIVEFHKKDYSELSGTRFHQLEEVEMLRIKHSKKMRLIFKQ